MATIRWAFTDRNAGACLTQFYHHPGELEKIDWEAVAATDFREMAVKERKQSEFLVWESFPWKLVEQIGVIDIEQQIEVERALGGLDIKPLVAVQRERYY